MRCKKISSLADMIETVILDIYKPPIRPWTWRQQTSLLAWHSSTRWCITIPNLVTKHSAFEEISSRWTFTGILNLSCDLDLDHNRAIQSFHKTIHLMMMCHQTKFRCRRISSSEDIRKSYFENMILHCDLNLEDSKPIFLKDNLADNDASPYQVW